MAPRRLTRWAGGLSIAAAALHGGVSVEHFEEWWGYGVFFLVSAAAQMVLGLALLTNAVNPKDAGESWRGLWRAMVCAGIVGNVLILLLYVVTRTLGIPFFGPGVGDVEAVAGIDAITGVLEVATVVILVWMLKQGPDGETVTP
ncbi:MAG TPA: hypothetical protein VM286_08455 [Candidatus Thermoplasmatota archaeon]|nr:hypothetical protein [Candidatus Thermoplasmatota archaeon]